MTKFTLVGFGGETDVAPITLPVQVPGPRSRVGWREAGILFENPDVAEVRVWEDQGDGRARETLVIDAERYADGQDWEPQSEILR